jgi:hypothetical protein
MCEAKWTTGKDLRGYARRNKPELLKKDSEFVKENDRYVWKLSKEDDKRPLEFSELSSEQFEELRRLQKALASENIELKIK